MYRLFVTDKHFIMRKDNLNDKALTISRLDSSSMNIVPKNELTFNDHGRMIYGCLGIFRIERESYLVIVTQSDVVGTIHYGPAGNDQNVIRKVTQTDFISFSTGRGVGNFAPDGMEDRPYYQVMSLLNSGYFYWIANGSPYDLTRSYQSQILDPKAHQPSWDRVDKRFYWNKHLQKDFIAYRLYDWCFPIIQGFVSHTNLGDIQGRNVTYTLISRRSRFRAGTRFNTRGVDDDGNVANFVETEQIVTIKDMGILSFVQTRGSVPVFWNQSTPQFTDYKISISNLSKIGKISKKKITILRTAHATTPAFQSHFKEQLNKYGNVAIINLLSKMKAGEADLVHAYEEQLAIMKSPTVNYYSFDLHEQLGKNGNRMDTLDHLIERIDQKNPTQSHPPVGYFFITARDKKITSEQVGTVRTNCKDCLDRTNIVQARVGWKLMEIHLKHLQLLRPHDSLDSYPHIAQALKVIWADNGDALSIQYAGSGSLKSTLTREGEYGLKGMLADGKKTMTRFYINNFKDNGRQDVLDQLLGIHATKSLSEGGADDRIRKQVADRKSEFSQKEYKNVFIGTYNVGGVPSRDFNLDSWLAVGNYPSPDIYVLGIQEVVELTAQQIIATESQIKHWEETIKRSLERVNPKVRYVQLQSNQLVGLMMCIYVQEEMVHSFREVQSQIIKVGLQGLAGNKGGIGVRLLINDTSFTFVTAHFAAGHGNVEDRISDYKDINEQARFGRQNQYRIESSDYSFWFGDFNFRIDLADDDIRRGVINNNLALLYSNDQLRKNMECGNVFRGYREDNILFAPTYKYDFNSTVYDTSPKQRAPAWTDRILWRNQKDHDLRQLYYRRAEILQSDHRPVSSYFQLQVLKVDKEKERQLRHQLYEQQDKTGGIANSSSGSNIGGSNADGANITKSLGALSIGQQAKPHHQQPLVQSHSLQAIDTYHGSVRDFSTPSQYTLHPIPQQGQTQISSNQIQQPSSQPPPPQVPQRRASRPLPLVPIDQIGNNLLSPQQQQQRKSPTKNLVDIDYNTPPSSSSPTTTNNSSRSSSPSYFNTTTTTAAGSSNTPPTNYSSSPSRHQQQQQQQIQQQLLQQLQAPPQQHDDFNNMDLFAHFNNPALNAPTTSSTSSSSSSSSIVPMNPYDNIINANLSYPPPHALVHSTTTVSSGASSTTSSSSGLTPMNPFVDNSPMVPIHSSAVQSLPSYYNSAPPSISQPQPIIHQMQQLPPPQLVATQPPMVLLTPTPNPIIYQPPPNMYHQQQQQQQQLQYPPPIDPINMNPNSQYLMNMQQHQLQHQQHLQYPSTTPYGGGMYNNNNLI